MDSRASACAKIRRARWGLGPVIARRWVPLLVKGGKERSVPIDTDVAGAIQTYLLAERRETDADALFVVAKGAHRGRPLYPAGLRTVSVFTASGPVSLPGIHTP